MVATTQIAKTPVAAPKKVAPSAVQRCTDLLKRSALQGRISADELDVIATLAGSLKVFMKS